MTFWRRPRRQFYVTLELRGRHPYLNSHHLDYEDSQETVVVEAKDWKDAERQGLSADLCQPCWSKRVISITSVA